MTTKKRFRWYSFRLLTLLVLAALMAIVAFALAAYKDRARIAALNRAVVNWSEYLQLVDKEYVGDDGYLFYQWSFAADPYQWSTMSGKAEKYDGGDPKWLPLTLDTYLGCGIFGGWKDSPVFSKDGTMVDGRDELWEWKWIDSSTVTHQILEIRFRLRPNRWQWLTGFSTPKVAVP